MKQKKEPIKSFSALREALGVKSKASRPVKTSHKRGAVDSRINKNTVVGQVISTELVLNKILNKKKPAQKQSVDKANQKQESDSSQYSGSVKKAQLIVPSTPIVVTKLHARVFNLSQSFNCQIGAIIDYLSLFFEREYSSTTLLYQNEFDSVVKYFAPGRELQLYKYYVSKQGDWPLKNGGAILLHDLPLVFEQNIFEKPVESYFNDGIISKSHFTDEQALNICKKMADSFARNIAVQFQQFGNSIVGHEYRNQVHYLANKALSMYGGPILTFLCNLRPLNFGNTSANTLFSKKLSEAYIDFPAMIFSSVKKDEKFTLVFHSLSGRPLVSKESCVRVYSSSSGGHSQIGSIDRKGYFLNKLHKTSPALLLFCESMKAGRPLKFFSGVETGTCFVCGRELSNPSSIRYGIGQTCLKNIGS